MTANYRTPSLRAPNVAQSNNEKLVSPDGARWANGRNVKMSGPNHTYTIVKLWRCKTRQNGKVVEVWQTLDRDEAKMYVATGLTK